MTRSGTLTRWAAAGLCTLGLAVGAIAEAGVASADCTSPGDFGAGSGCPPPGDDSSSGSGGSGESWPPTSVDWPPSQSSGPGSDTGGKQGTPIVLPAGQSPPAKTADDSGSTSTSTPPTPIVPAGGGPAAAANPTVIVAAGS